MIEYLPNLLVAWGILCMGLFSPGPNILAVIGTSMASGRGHGSALAMGISMGSGLWAILTVLGLSALIAAYAQALLVLKIAGAAYLLWLAWKSFRSAMTPKPDPVIRSANGARRALFLRGLGIQMSNPKAALSWIAIVALGLGTDAPWQVAAILVVGSTLISMAGHLAYATLFSSAAVVRAYAGARRRIELGLGCFFVFASYKLATAKV
ncbi:MAG: LysE family translocator [Sulfitobacter sp.]